MRTKRIIAILMTVMLLAGTVQNLGVFVRAVETVTPPEVVISGVRVTSDGTDSGPETGYLEVSVHATTTDFQSVGVVLSYDTGVLTPVDWNTTGSTVPISGTMWTTVVPSKGADNFSGKPALAREDEPTEPGEGETEAPAAAARGYLYLGAESLQYQPVTDTRLVTVRFKIAPEGSGYKDVKIPTAEADLQNENLTLCLAPEKIAETAAPAAPVLLSRGEAAEIVEGELNPTAVHVLKFYTWHADAGEENCAVSFRIGKGESINAGTAQPTGGGYAITFFDWDGRVIDAIAVAPETAKALVAQWEDDHKDRLGNKPGYQFDCWLVVQENNDGKGLVTEKGTFTSNDAKLDPDTDADVKADVADLDHLFADGKTSVFLQAAYYARTSPEFSDNLVNGGGSSNADRYYTISDPVFTRYGAADAVAGSYSLTMTVTRKQENGTTGVTRLREPAIWVAMTPAEGENSANIMNLIRLENTDTTTFEIVTTKQIKSVSYKVIDVYGVSNWPGCADRSDATKGVRDRNTCITRGTQGYLAEQAYNVWKGGSWEATVNNWAFADCFYGTTNAKASATWWTDDLCNKAKTALLNATNSKGEKLDYAEVLAAVNGVT